MNKALVNNKSAIGVVYLARGADQAAREKFEKFAASYKKRVAGVAHRTFIIFKGFQNSSDLSVALDVFSGLDYEGIYVEDHGFDLGAYFAAAARVNCEKLCFVNTSSEILGDDWLLKLSVNLAQPGVGLVGCTGSYESPQQSGMGDVVFPNPHLRSNAFMIERRRFLRMCPVELLADKNDAHLLEHGPNSITRMVAADGLKTLVVGKDGRGYEPLWWWQSQTFRQGTQKNLLVSDNQTNRFQNAPIAEKRFLFSLCWGGESFPRICRKKETSTRHEEANDRVDDVLLSGSAAPRDYLVARAGR